MAGQKPGGEKPSGQKPGQNGTPLGGHASDELNPNNRVGGAPPGSSTERTAVNAQASRWGTLPEHAQAVFSSRGGEELPPRYRDWIDSYHRRLNREK